MNPHTFDDLAFTIELSLRGVGYLHRQRTKPNLTEIEARAASMEVARDLRAHWTLVRRNNYAGHGAAAKV